MSLKISYLIERGNTVPYPPLFDDIRRNYGFVDLRGKLERVYDVPETAESPALLSLLLGLADQKSTIMSVGCDLGSKKHKDDQLSRRCRAGGYVQIAILPLALPDLPRLEATVRAAEFDMRANVGEDSWEIGFARCITHFNIEEFLVTETLWIWFDAVASTPEEARAARERLITSLSRGLKPQRVLKDE